MPVAIQERVCPRCKLGASPEASACSHCGYRFDVPAKVTTENDRLGLRVRVLWFVPVCILVFYVGLGGILAARLMKSGAYKSSLSIAESSAEMKSLLGNDIRSNWPVPLGWSLPFFSSEFAQWSVGLTGSHGKGMLYGVANQVNGTWEFSRLVFVSHDGKVKTDLTPMPSRLDLPPVPEKKVFLIPMGLMAEESLDWAPRYYKAKLGVDVTVLPAAPLGAGLENEERHQLDSDKCYDFISGRYPKLARDPSVILIAVTSGDMFIPGFYASYAENMRFDDRFAVISSSRLRPSPIFDRLNPEWFRSRVQKLLTKNLALLYFNLPMSSDYNSMLSGGVLAGIGFDMMGGQLIVGKNGWHSFVNQTDPEVTVYDVPGKPVLWKFALVSQAVPDTNVQVFTTDVSLGMFIQRKTDFFFDDPYPLQFTRVYTSSDDRSRSFGVGAQSSLDWSLAGQMGYWCDLYQEDGSKIRYERVKSPPGGPDQIYRAAGGVGEAVYFGNVWRVTNLDGWTRMFPFRPQALPDYVTVLTSFTAPDGHNYKMERNSFGDLLSITTPSGKWLRFETDAQHRIKRITSSVGRTVDYEYDAAGHLIRAKDSDGHEDRYSYDARGFMSTISHGAGKPVLTNHYAVDGYIRDQILGDGQKFEYWTGRSSRNVADESEVTDPNGLHTFIKYGANGYTQSLPTPTPH